MGLRENSMAGHPKIGLGACNGLKNHLSWLDCRANRNGRCRWPEGDCGKTRKKSYCEMTDERIQKIKSAVESCGSYFAEKKTELLAVLAKLKPASPEVRKQARRRLRGSAVRRSFSA